MNEKEKKKVENHENVEHENLLENIWSNLLYVRLYFQKNEKCETQIQIKFRVVAVLGVGVIRGCDKLDVE